MSEAKILKAKCEKHGLYFGMELKESRGQYRVTNMIRITEEEAGIICSEVRQSVFETAPNLVPCHRCGNRKLGGCSCAPRAHSCSADMKYHFDCIYCKHFRVDYTRTGRVPYGEWAGVTNIPGAIKDKYGNPQGGQYDLMADGSMKGYRVIVFLLYDGMTFNSPRAALERKGFEVLEYRISSLPTPAQLSQLLEVGKTQIWVISDCTARLNSGHVDVICDFFHRGGGVYIWGDNEPYYVDANTILGKLFSTEMYGDVPGGKVIGVRSGDSGGGIRPDHPITTALANFYEGITIATVKLTQGLEPLFWGSAGNLVCAYYDTDGCRALVDGGFTRLYCNWDTAGTDRYVVNAAAWLANMERFGYLG